MYLDYGIQLNYWTIGLLSLNHSIGTDLPTVSGTGEIEVAIGSNLTSDWRHGTRCRKPPCFQGFWVMAWSTSIPFLVSCTCFEASNGPPLTSKLLILSRQWAVGTDGLYIVRMTPPSSQISFGGWIVQFDHLHFTSGAG